MRAETRPGRAAAPRPVIANRGTSRRKIRMLSGRGRRPVPGTSPPRGAPNRESRDLEAENSNTERVR